jgi:hypothetical protein
VITVPTEPALFFLLTGGVAIVGFAAWYFSQDQRTRRALRNRPRTTVREAVDGQEMKIVGTVRFLGPPLKAPLSGTPCAHYRVTVVHRKQRSSSVIIREEQGVDFILEDATGRARVLMAGARVAVNMDNESRSGTFDADERQEALLTRHGKASQWWIFNKSLTYSEGILEEGEEVAVFGRARWEIDPDPGSGYREPPRRLVIEHGNAGPLLVSDHRSVLK